MSSGLEMIARELRRLQQEGVGHVFVEDATVALLEAVSAKAPATGTSTPSRTPKSSKGRDAGGADLQKLVNEAVTGTSKPERKPTAPAQPTAVKPLPEQPPAFDLPAEGDAGSRLAWLEQRVRECPTCNEHLSKHGQLVFGTGSATADIFFCGEAPGAEEEKSGEPFVGKAGQLLSKIIQAMGLHREDVYIANILKWRPEHDKPYGNRPPTPAEMRFCLPYVKAQIEIVRPRVIVALGNTAATGFLGHDPNRRMGSIRGKWHEFEGIPMMITFHPSYLLRNGTLKMKRTVWEDLLQVMDKAEMPISEKQRGFFLPKN